MFSTNLSLKSAWVGLLLLLFLIEPARADVWCHVDGRGVAHFAAERLDDRYELFFKGAQPAAKPAATPRGVTVPTQSQRLLAFFEVSPHYKSVQHVLRDSAAQHRLDEELLKAVIATESGFDPQVVSRRGAVGLMQIMPATAQRWGVSGDAQSSVEIKLTDPALNIRTGARYLGHLLKIFSGQLELALAAYNAGEGAVQRAGNRIPNIRETQNYVKTVLHLYALLRPPEAIVGSRRSARAQAAVDAVSAGGAQGRGNMPAPLQAPAPAIAQAPLPPAAPGAAIDFY